MPEHFKRREQVIDLPPAERLTPSAFPFLGVVVSAVVEVVPALKFSEFFEQLAEEIPEFVDGALRAVSE